MFSKPFFPKLSTKQLVSLAMLMALSVVVSKFSIPIIPNQLVFSLTFIASAMIGAIGGPAYGFVALALIDLIDSMTGGTANFIIWWTLMEAVQGAPLRFLLLWKIAELDLKNGLGLCQPSHSGHYDFWNLHLHAPLNSNLFQSSHCCPIYRRPLVENL